MTYVIDADRRRLAAYLTQHGATQGSKLRTAMGWKMSRFWDAVDWPPTGWFLLTIEGWRLTERGQAEGHLEGIA